jgi:hypothetical protein
LPISELHGGAEGEINPIATDIFNISCPVPVVFVGHIEDSGRVGYFGKGHLTGPGVLFIEAA